MARQAKFGRNDKVNYTGGNMVLALWLAAACAMSAAAETSVELAVPEGRERHVVQVDPKGDDRTAGCAEMHRRKAKAFRREPRRRRPEVMTRPQVASRSEVARGLRASGCATEMQKPCLNNYKQQLVKAKKRKAKL